MRRDSKRALELGLYLVVALPTGERKSTVMREALAPLRAIEQELQHESVPSRRERAQRRAILEGQEERLKKGAIREENRQAREQLERELLQVAPELDEQPELPKPRLLCDDATPEGIVKLLSQHGRLAFMSAESALVDDLLGKYDGRGTPNLHVVCQAYSGGPTQIDRASGDPKSLDRPLLAITLAPQPHVLERIAAHEIARCQGLVGRCAFVLPTSRLGSRSIAVPATSSQVRAAWAALVRRVASPNRVTEVTERGPEGDSVTSVTTSLKAGSGTTGGRPTYLGC